MYFLVEQNSPLARCKQTPNKITLNFPVSMASGPQETERIVSSRRLLTTGAAEPQPLGDACTAQPQIPLAAGEPKPTPSWSTTSAQGTAWVIYPVLKHPGCALLGDDIAGPKHRMTHCSTDAPAWLVQSPAGTNFIDALFSQDDRKGDREQGTLHPCIFPDHIYSTLPSAGRLRACW